MHNGILVIVGNLSLFASLGRFLDSQFTFVNVKRFAFGLFRLPSIPLYQPTD